MADFISVPFYDLFHESGHVPRIRASLPPLLAGVRGSILEIGAGTGLLTRTLADVTQAEVFALEPSAGMRAVLLSRLGSRPELLGRVTVLPCDALSVRLDEPAGAVVVISEEEITGCAYRPPWDVLRRELTDAGFTQADGADGLLAWRLA